jgi:hypothetical protein
MRRFAVSSSLAADATSGAVRHLHSGQVLAAGT